MQTDKPHHRHRLYRGNADKPDITGTGHNYGESADKPHITGTGHTGAVQRNQTSQTQELRYPSYITDRGRSLQAQHKTWLTRTRQISTAQNNVVYYFTQDDQV